MKDILQLRYRPFLLEFMRTSPLLAFDFDGTLSPIVSRPSQVRVRLTTRRLLVQLGKRYPIAILSGRAREDVRARTLGLGTRLWVGNHGSDWGEGDPGSDRWARKILPWLPILAAELGSEPGLEIEDKGMSVSVHFRRSPHPRRTLRHVLDVARTLSGVRTIGGKCVVNFVPEAAPDKGKALLKLMKAERRKTALFMGDDVTDEDGFRESLHHPGVLGVRVGISQKSDARFGISDQRAIDHFLRVLLELSRVLE